MPARRAARWFALALAIAAETACGTTLNPLTGILGLPEPLSAVDAASGYPSARHLVPDRPHPAVARIVVPEGNEATSYGSGTLVDVRDQFGLVVTNWHVVRDGTGEVEVIFPDGFRSKARPLKVDSDWDLAALVIWRPPVQPVTIAAVAPQPGERLTICGYGSGQYRAATGRCTQYYAPSLDLPQHMVELDVEARQGDSGGPIFNDRGELAGVLFGAGRGTTLGSFGGRVESFLAPLAPNIGRPAEDAIAHRQDAAPNVEAAAADRPSRLASSAPAVLEGPTPLLDEDVTKTGGAREPRQSQLAFLASSVDNSVQRADQGWRAVAASPMKSAPSVAATSSGGMFSHAKNVLAVVGVLALVLQVLRIVR